ncbi:hypothetical protein MIR68_001404 [Amoeboaphelidium protococcarum]|nr:hypothetical protein MIR68_001404 [Amoeboaphelidium protococcarum]
MLKDKVVFISGASRGIGKAIAIRLAMDGAKVAVASKSSGTQGAQKLPGTIEQTAEEIEKVGGQSLAIQCDIRFEQEVQNAIQQTVDRWGGIDILINNASAISLTDTPNTAVKKFDLMNQINGRGTWLCTKLALPHLIKSAQSGRNPQVLNLSPPLSVDTQWFAPHTAYTIAKFNMSMCTLGMSEEFKQYGISVNSLWPRTAIDTAAMKMIPGAADQRATMRRVGIMADSAYVLLNQQGLTGVFAIDDDIILSQGFKRQDLDIYSNTRGMKESDLFPDFFIPEGYKTPLSGIKSKKVLRKLDVLSTTGISEYAAAQARL